MIAAADPYYTGAMVPQLVGTMGAFPTRLLDSPYVEAPSLMKEPTVQQAVGNKLATSRARLKVFHMLGVGDLPVMIGGGVLGMIFGEVVTASSVVQWTLIAAGILFGLLTSIAVTREATRR